MVATKFPIILLRLEGPMQSWGLQSRFRVRETAAEPTKSGVIGLIACCLGRTRHDSIDDLTEVEIAVRVDRPGVLWRDYHTVGAGYGVMSADGKVKRTATTGEPETLVTDRFYLCDASFLVALTGPAALLERIENALKHPVWPPYLGRKSCPPARPIFCERTQGSTLLHALESHPWKPRLGEVDSIPGELACVVPAVPDDEGAIMQHDCPISFAGPRPMSFRYVKKVWVKPPVGEPVQSLYKAPEPIRMNYRTAEWKRKRLERGKRDNFLCVFCNSPSAITHHITYERARNEDVERDLRSVCRLCHDAVTMLEAERDMGRERIDPLSEEYRLLILMKRQQIETQRETGRRKRS